MTDGHYYYEFRVLLRCPDGTRRSEAHNLLQSSIDLDEHDATLQSVSAVRRTHTSELDGMGTGVQGD